MTCLHNNCFVFFLMHRHYTLIMVVYKQHSLALYALRNILNAYHICLLLTLIVSHTTLAQLHLNLNTTSNKLYLCRLQVSHFI